MNHEKSACHVHTDHGHSLLGELICHLPYAIGSVSLGLIILSFMSVFGILPDSHHHVHEGVHSHGGGFFALFHTFHFLHIVFATTGALVTFSRFSNKIVKGLIVSLISAFFFCTLSDVILPYVGAHLLGVPIRLHICFWSELHNIIPFMVVGLLNGFIMSRHKESNKGIYSVMSHFAHIFTSSLASMFYLFAEGFTQWYSQMGILFILLILAVVIPCTFADVIVPVFFARPRKVDERNSPHKHKKNI